MSEVSKDPKPLSDSEEKGRKVVEDQIGTAVAQNKHKTVRQLRGKLIKAKELGIISKIDAHRTAIGVEHQKKKSK